MTLRCFRIVLSLVVSPFVLACGGPPSSPAASACMTACATGSSGAGGNESRASEGETGDPTPIPGTSEGEGSGPGDTGSETSAGSTTGGEPIAHPDGLDPWLPDLTDEECPITYPWQDAMADLELTPRRVCPEGCEHTTLTDALAAAQPGDEILLAPGEYHECVDVTVSPLVIRGDNGLARFTGFACEGDNPEAPSYNSVFALRGEYIRLESIEVSAYAGTAVYLSPSVQQAVLERMLLQDVDFAILGSPKELLLLRKSKIKDAGWISEPGAHANKIIGVHGQAFISDRNVFSHYRDWAWLIGTNDLPHIEFVCSVIAKVVDTEALHSLHIFGPGTIVLTHNFIHEKGEIYNYTYNFGGLPPTMIMEGNEFIMDHERGDFIGTFDTRATIRAIDNVVVGGQGLAPLERYTDPEVAGNVEFADRAAAGMDPFPALPSTWPISQL